jgi:hypothetical protein
MKYCSVASYLEMGKLFALVPCTKNVNKKSDWGTLVPRINVENGIKLGFLLE